ncbi:MAG: hypothetical protein HY897_20660 [Deltaproteobacteria bacterium]|nr:hypothetical protein [Deltaproteobacteria bacterium]
MACRATLGMAAGIVFGIATAVGACGSENTGGGDGGPGVAIDGGAADSGPADAGRPDAGGAGTCLPKDRPRCHP